MYTIYSLKNIDNEHDISRGAECIKKFYESLREHEMKTIICDNNSLIVIFNKQKEGIIQKYKNKLNL